MAVFVLDTFTDANAVYLYRDGGAPTHVGEIGAVWMKHPSGLDFNYEIQANRIHCNSGPGYVYASGAPLSADYYAECVLWGVTDVANDGQPGPCIRLDTTADTCYTARYQNDANTWILEKRVAGTPTSLATWAEADWTGNNRTIRVEAIGSAIKGYVEGTLRLSATDTAIPTAGVVGIRSPNSAVTAAGVHVDSIVAVSAVAHPNYSRFPKIPLRRP